MIDMNSYDMNSHDENSYDMSSHDENLYDVNSYDIMKSYTMMLVLFPVTGITTSSCYADACSLPKLFPFFFIIAENRPNIVFW
jgi:hypothetical protein